MDSYSCSKRPEFNAETAEKIADELAEQERLDRGGECSKSTFRYHGVITAASGLQYVVLLAGTGKSPNASSKVVVHYEGRLMNDHVFDSSIRLGRPAEFGLNQVISGWTEGLQLMKVGGKSRFFVPPHLAYGSEGTKGIPSNSTLIFYVELLEVE